MKNTTENKRPMNLETRFSFDVTEEQYTKLQEWLAEVNKEAMEIQKKTYPKAEFPYTYCWERGEPYYGAIGGGLTYRFLPTSIGDCLHVKESITGKEIDLTDFGNFG
jgi:hypothetical protein